MVQGGEIETAHPDCLGSQDTFYVGNMKGVGRIYQQTFVDTYAKVAFAKLCTASTYQNSRLPALVGEDDAADQRMLFSETEVLPRHRRRCGLRYA